MSDNAAASCLTDLPRVVLTRSKFAVSCESSLDSRGGDIESSSAIQIRLGSCKTRATECQIAQRVRIGECHDEVGSKLMCVGGMYPKKGNKGELEKQARNNNKPLGRFCSVSTNRLHNSIALAHHWPARELLSGLWAHHFEPPATNRKVPGLLANRNSLS